MSYAVGDKVKVSATSHYGNVEKGGLDGTIKGYIIKLDKTLPNSNGYTAGFNYIVTENLKGADRASKTGRIESKVSGGKRKSRKVVKTKKHRSTRRHH